MRGTKLVLSDWTVVVRFDDGSSARLTGSAVPPELRIRRNGADPTVSVWRRGPLGVRRAV
jgi:hypothetical protein